MPSFEKEEMPSSSRRKLGTVEKKGEATEEVGDVEKREADREVRVMVGSM